MTPPIFTPDGTEVEEVILPDGSVASEVIAPDGTVVFEGIPDNVVDNFEDANGDPTGVYADGEPLSDYYSGAQNGIPSGVQRTTAVVFEGDYSVEVNSSLDNGAVSRSGDGLNRYYSASDDGILSCRMYVEDDSSSAPVITYGVLSNEFSGYGVRIGHSGFSDPIELRRYDDGSETSLGGRAGFSNWSEWVRVEIDWNGLTHNVSIYDENNSQIYAHETTDDTYSSGDGIGFVQSDSGGGYIDDISVIK